MSGDVRIGAAKHDVPWKKKRTRTILSYDVIVHPYAGFAPLLLQTRYLHPFSYFKVEGGLRSSRENQNRGGKCVIYKLDRMSDFILLRQGVSIHCFVRVKKAWSGINIPQIICSSMSERQIASRGEELWEVIFTLSCRYIENSFLKKKHREQSIIAL